MMAKIVVETESQMKLLPRQTAMGQHRKSLNVLETICESGALGAGSGPGSDSDLYETGNTAAAFEVQAGCADLYVGRLKKS